MIASRGRSLSQTSSRGFVMFGWRLVPEDIWNKYTSRVEELERREGELIDRIVLLQGQPPVTPQGLERMDKEQKAAKSIFEELKELHPEETAGEEEK
jgi:hypothetical protein